jgi:anthranilate phosphoribosyltransferase
VSAGILQTLLKKLLDEGSLAEAELSTLFLGLFDGALTPAQGAAILVSLKTRGETGFDLACAARAARARMKAAPLTVSGAVDLCGTGGDGASTFNISTAAALVVAACGVPVAKHGNRAVSSRSGSADVLEALGIVMPAEPKVVAGMIETIGFGFFFAPLFHPGFAALKNVRAELGVRTLFNLIGPLLNPASVRRQLIGVSTARVVPVVADALRRLGTECTWVVHSDGLDELSPCAESLVTEVRGDAMREFTVSPRELGFEKRSMAELVGGDARDNAQRIQRVFEGEQGAARDAVVLNAAAALVVAEKTDNLRAAVDVASQAIDTGKVGDIVKRLRAFQGAAA